MSAKDTECSPDVTLAFYRRLYPFKSIFTWLNHQNPPTKLFTHREFAFTLLGDVYLRYNSFNNADDLKREVCRLNPTRFEVGPVYSARPRDKKTMRAATFTPLLRELVFDIDMTDYDEVRTCCTGKGICSRCWAFIAAAVKILDRILREDFDFKHLLWVYSGRRGIHCWISDQSALALSDDSRRAIVHYIEVIKGGKEMTKKVNVRLVHRNGSVGGLHPMLADSLSYLRTVFGELILKDQDCFEENKGWETLLELLPNKKINEKLRKQWEADLFRASDLKWQDLISEVSALGKDSAEQNLMMAALEDVVLQYTYPRIDSEVSKHRNHLLKAPFCVHPATGRVCVPIDPARVSDFDPEKVPTVGQLLRELDGVAAQNGEPHHSDWTKTSLKPYVDMLDQHVAKLMKVVREQNRAEAERQF
ncbi:hypothetical protein BOTBODRAFT_70886 [Botryobasidium botryosum FD-172 SS1]|uniref:DNA primase n=1 Tax=Botryobasidium botryosum (strain FD-172 SS1) TaxID=930990 RepID=A0A067LW99_BOTB1|nr:hypothetical protein BOTBODRAFT_70886 [Botryobasidium botryosum FD-172 SS1]